MSDALGLGFAAAIEFLRQRVELGDGEWEALVTEIDGAARERAEGMVAAMQRDVLRAALRAVETGAAFDTFLKDFEAALARWGGDASDRDATRHRAGLAFDVLTRQAYAAGAWRGYQRLKEARPYLRYIHVDPELEMRDSRPEHAAWHDLVLPVDDPFWRTHYPPNGWNCRCTVISYSADDVVRDGLTVSESPEVKQVIRFVRGQPVLTPEGIDPGFAYNVGEVGLRLPPLPEGAAPPE